MFLRQGESTVFIGARESLEIGICPFGVTDFFVVIVVTFCNARFRVIEDCWSTFSGSTSFERYLRLDNNENEKRRGGYSTIKETTLHPHPELVRQHTSDSSEDSSVESSVSGGEPPNFSSASFSTSANNFVSGVALFNLDLTVGV